MAAAPTDRLPDLGMGRPRELVVQWSHGQRRLRFTSLIVNVGAGPFETRASRKTLAAKTMAVRQIVYNTAGGHRAIATASVAKYAGDGHNHWHVQKVAGYELFAATGDGPALRRGAKVGFCFFDTRLYRPSLPRTPKARRYFERTCGVRNSRAIKVGLSVGWSDIYPWNFAWQWINVTSLPGGDYLLKLSADPGENFLEAREDNNCNWTRIHIPKTGSKVTVLGFTNGCHAPGRPPEPTPTPSEMPSASPGASAAGAPLDLVSGANQEVELIDADELDANRPLFACTIPMP